MVVNDDSPEGRTASCDVARCCSSCEPFFPDYVQFPDDCPVIDWAVDLPRVPFSLNWSEVENNTSSDLYSTPFNVSGWQPSPTMGVLGDVVGYGPYLPHPESTTMYAGNQLSPSLSNLEDTLPLLDQSAFQNLDGDSPHSDDISDSTSSTIWLSDLGELQQVSGQKIPEMSSTGASLRTYDTMTVKGKSIHDSPPPQSEQDQKRCKSFQEHFCRWQGCESAFDDVQRLR